MAVVPVVLEHDEVAEQVEEPPLVEHAADQHLELAHVVGRERLALDGAPGQEALLVRRQRADARFEPVADDEQLVEDEERRQLLLVGLELLERAPDGRVLARGVLQLDDGDRQAVQEHDDVGARLWPPS
jgi:hypothetical protein